MLLNTTGKVLKVYSLKRGMNVPGLAGFAKGMYFLKVQRGGNDVEIRKLVIL